MRPRTTLMRARASLLLACRPLPQALPPHMLLARLSLIVALLSAAVVCRLIMGGPSRGATSLIGAGGFGAGGAGDYTLIDTHCVGSVFILQFAAFGAALSASLASQSMDAAVVARYVDAPVTLMLLLLNVGLHAWFGYRAWEALTFRFGKESRTRPSDPELSRAGYTSV